MTSKTVLIIDDEEDLLLTLAICFNTNGFEVETASDGAAGLAKAKSLRPDAVVLDLELPELGGWQVLRRLREDAATKDIPVVIITAGQRGPAEQKAKAEGRPRLLFKPFNVNDLVSSVQEAMDGTGP